MKVHLAQLQPHDKTIAGRRRLLKWPKMRGVFTGKRPAVIHVLASGLVCELDDCDLEEARSFCNVKILATKDVPDAESQEEANQEGDQEEASEEAAQE